LERLKASVCDYHTIQPELEEDFPIMAEISGFPFVLQPSCLVQLGAERRPEKQLAPHRRPHLRLIRRPKPTISTRNVLI
jgi:hypothetical protein